MNYSASSQYPAARPRRLRQSAWIREMVAEVRLHPSDLIWPIFIQEGSQLETPIASMPNVSRMSLDIAVSSIKEAKSLGIPAVALFPLVDGSKKNEMGDEALNPDNLICRAIKTFKNAVPDIGIITDIALDPYTSHGQDGVLENGQILNDVTMDILAQQALLHASAGADIVAPSDMMDGRVGAIRMALELEGFSNTMILAYAAKYASAHYGPFRDAVGSAEALHAAAAAPAMSPRSGVRQANDSLDHLLSVSPCESQQAFTGANLKSTYQMDVRNSDEALREIAMDIAEGADMVMVKPGISYLDIVARAASSFNVPVFAYQVSGEYAMVKAASEKGWIDGDAVMMEQLLCFKRAGARAILTYAAIDAAKWITDNR